MATVLDSRWNSGMGPARKGATDKSRLQRAMMILKAPGQGHKETSASDLTEQLASPC